MTVALAGVVFTPLIGAVFAFLFPGVAQRIGVVSVCLMFISMVSTLILLPESGYPLIRLGGWEAPLGIRWRVDGLALIALGLTNTVALGISIYAHSYFHTASATAAFWPLWLLLLAGLNALFLSNDIFNLYVTLEIVGLAGVGLVATAQNVVALQAAFRYLTVSLTGSLFFLAGVAIVYARYSTLDMTMLHELTSGDPQTWTAMTLMTIGLLMKTAVFPMHFWLPPAHASAPAPVSAALSALVVKSSFIILLRLWLEVAPPLTSNAPGLLLGLLGSGAVIWGSICALRTSRLKLLIAYSTVGQLGYLMLLFPFAQHDGPRSVAFNGVLCLIVAHGCTKSAMFLAAGNLQTAAGHDQISGLADAARQLPVTMFAFAIAGASIMGLPPTAGFIAKWTLLTAALNSGQWFWLVVIAVGSLLSFGYIFRILVLAFNDTTTDNPADGSKVNRAMQWSPLILALLAVAFGLSATPLFDLLAVKALIGEG